MKACGWFSCSPTQSLSTQGPCCPYTPAIVGPDRPSVIGFAPFLLVSLPKDSPESQNPLYSPFAFSHPHGCCASFAMPLPALPHWSNSHSNHSASALLAHPPPSLVCPSTISLWPTPPLSGVYWAKAILYSFLFNTRLSPLLHHFITLSICVCMCAHKCLCVCVKL